MSSRPFQFASSEFYHVYNRGVDKRTIFLDDADHRRFTELLYVANTTKPIDLRVISRQHSTVYEWERGEALVAIGAYCLMPNHFHLLLTPLAEQGVSLFMNKLCTSYSMYFNRRYKRSGALFEGKFKAKHVTSDEYLKYLFSYIHLNPVKLLQPNWREQGIVNTKEVYRYVSTFQYSSLQDFVGTVRSKKVIIEPKAFPEYFSGQGDLERELFDWLSFGEATEPQQVTM